MDVSENSGTPKWMVKIMDNSEFLHVPGTIQHGDHMMIPQVPWAENKQVW